MVPSGADQRGAALSFIESGKLSRSIEEVAVAEVLADCEAMIDAQARQRTREPPPHDGPRVRLLSARDGRRGVEMALQAVPAVILMGINLPGIDGTAALRLLAAAP